MARTINQIKALMVATKGSQSTLNGLTSTSQTATWNLLFYIPAVGIALLEQLMDIFKANTDATINSAISPSNAWLQKMVFKFQYSATVPQIVALNNFSPSYPITDPTLQIISRCSVTTTAQRIVTVKVATGIPPTALSAPQISSLNGYLTQGGNGTVAGAGTGIGYTGVQISIISLLPDRLFLEGIIYYNGQYASTIVSNCITALNAYLAAIPFDGRVKVISITDALQGVPGFSDVNFKNIAMWAQYVGFTGKTYLINNETEVLNSYATFAGYIIQEDTVGQTFTDKLTFVVA